MTDDDRFPIDYATLAGARRGKDASHLASPRPQHARHKRIREQWQPIGYEGPNKVTHDISGFCTSKEHALTVARFLQHWRQEQDRVVTFTLRGQRTLTSPQVAFSLLTSLLKTSVGNTYTNTDQYQVTSRTIREDGTLDVRAVYMPAGHKRHGFHRSRVRGGRLMTALQPSFPALEPASRSWVGGQPGQEHFHRR